MAYNYTSGHLLPQPQIVNYSASKVWWENVYEEIVANYRLIKHHRASAHKGIYRSDENFKYQLRRYPRLEHRQTYKTMADDVKNRWLDLKSYSKIEENFFEPLVQKLKEPYYGNITLSNFQRLRLDIYQARTKCDGYRKQAYQAEVNEQSYLNDYKEHLTRQEQQALKQYREQQERYQEYMQQEEEKRPRWDAERLRWQEEENSNRAEAPPKPDKTSRDSHQTAPENSRSQQRPQESEYLVKAVPPHSNDTETEKKLVSLTRNNPGHFIKMSRAINETRRSDQQEELKYSFDDFLQAYNAYHDVEGKFKIRTDTVIRWAKDIQTRADLPDYDKAIKMVKEYRLKYASDQKSAEAADVVIHLHNINDILPLEIDDLTNELYDGTSAFEKAAEALLRIEESEIDAMREHHLRWLKKLFENDLYSPEACSREREVARDRERK